MASKLEGMNPRSSTMVKTTPRVLQQQPSRHSDPQQQQAGSSDFQPGANGGKQPQMGEGSYEGSREYQERTEEYLKKGSVEKDAEAAKPGSAEEARDLEQAEEEENALAKGEG
ncbi:MAG: hypothetical protein NVS3B2_05480 [Ramlibacter sp.]